MVHHTPPPSELAVFPEVERSHRTHPSSSLSSLKGLVFLPWYVVWPTNTNLLTQEGTGSFVVHSLVWPGPIDVEERSLSNKFRSAITHDPE